MQTFYLSTESTRPILKPQTWAELFAEASSREKIVLLRPVNGRDHELRLLVLSDRKDNDGLLLIGNDGKPFGEVSGKTKALHFDGFQTPAYTIVGCLSLSPKT